MFKLEFSTNNAAFDDNRIEEVARILDVMRGMVRMGGGTGPVRDVNGNTIGRWAFTNN